MVAQLDPNGLETVLDMLMQGTLELGHLPPPLRALILYGFELGRESVQDRLAQAEYERDVLFERFHNPGKKFAPMVQRRLEQAAEAHADELDAAKYYEAVLDAATTPKRAA